MGYSNTTILPVWTVDGFSLDSSPPWLTGDDRSMSNTGWPPLIVYISNKLEGVSASKQSSNCGGRRKLNTERGIKSISPNIDGGSALELTAACVRQNCQKEITEPIGRLL